MKSVHHFRYSRRDFLRQIAVGAATVGAFGVRGATAAPAETGQRKLGVALVGLGRYSTGQLGPALRETKHCRLAGVVTGSSEKAAKWAQDFDLPKRCIYNYTTMEQMADNPDIDIVYVVTPNGLHARHAIAAARAGKHVIVEKPMANTVAECDAILAACRAAKVKHSIGYRLHFDPYHREMVRLARDKGFGPFMTMNGNRSFELAPGKWRADKALAGGGPMMDLGIYIIQAACMVSGGAPVTVTATELPKTKPAQFGEGVEETIQWTMKFPNGAVCEARTSYVGPSNDSFRAAGDKGWIHFKEKAFTYRGTVCETSRGVLNFQPFVNQQALQMDDFAICVRDGLESRVPGEMGRRDLTIIEAIYKAARTGEQVPV